MLLLRSQRVVTLQARQLLLFVLEDRPDFLFLIVGEAKFLAESLQLMFGLIATSVLRTRCIRRWLTRVLGERPETGKQQGYQKYSEFQHGSFSFNDCVSTNNVPETMNPARREKLHGWAEQQQVRRTVSAPHSMGCFEQALLGFFLALDAMASPWNSFETFRVDLFSAGNAFAEAPLAEASQSTIHHLEQLTVVVALAEEKFLVIRTGGAIGDVLGGLVVRTATVLLVAGHHVTQFFLPRFQPLSEIL
jgi:hypothetical protein